MSVRQIPLAEIGEPELDRWRRLAEAAIEPNPFFEPEYLLAQARALGGLGDVALAVVTDGDAWTACMPVRRLRSWHRIPIASLSTWRGSEALPSLVGTPLLSAPEAAAALVRGLVSTAGSSFAALEWLVADGPAYGPISDAIAQSGLRCIEFERLERAFLTRRPQDDYFERSMKGKHRGVMRRRWKKLDAQLGGEPQVVDVTGDSAAVEELIEIEGASRLAAGGMVLRADPAYEQFFREMCAGFAAAGRLQLHALRFGDQTLAIRCNLLADPGIFYFKVAYDEAFARVLARHPARGRVVSPVPRARAVRMGRLMLGSQQRDHEPPAARAPDAGDARAVKPGVRAALTAGALRDRAASARARHGGVAGSVRR